MSKDSNHSLNKAPIFIVGVPRSGTTLLAALISSHSKIACGPETHFFSKTSWEQREQAVTDVDWPNKAVQLITSLKLTNQKVYKLFNLTEEQVYTYLENREPSQSAMLDSLTVQFADKFNKPLWAEKTPNHILYLPEILKLYPDTPIIHIVRDPRDSCNSMLKLSHTNDSPIINSYLWYEWTKKIVTETSTGKHVITIKYENLLQTPSLVLNRLCNHIGINFENNMTDPSTSAKHVISKNEPWKKKVKKPIDPDNAYKWKKQMPQYEVNAISMICHEGIKSYNYSNPILPKKTIPVYGLNWNTADSISQEILELAQKKVFLKPVKSEELCKLRPERHRHRDLFIIKMPNLGDTRWERLISAIRITIRLFMEIANGTKIRFYPKFISRKSLASTFIYKTVTTFGKNKIE